MRRSSSALAQGQIEPGSCKVVAAGGREVTVFNVDGTLYATQVECTHQGGPLCAGSFLGEIVTCPWHGSQFNVRTGEVVNDPAKEPLKTYPVSIVNGDVMIG